ncbi:MAG: hypothetical protein ACR2PH_06355 [Desulfobulbia bacterium]
MAGKYYIDNVKFYDELVIFLDACKKAEAAGEELPRVPEYVGECFMLLARNMGKAPNFSRYPFLQDMQSDAVINCVKYVRNFDPSPDRGKNPFAYFSQYVKNAFLQRIRLEKKSLYTRYKEYQSFCVSEQLEGLEGYGPPELNEISNSFIRHFEDQLEREKIKKKLNRAKQSNTLSKYFEDENNE